MKNLKFNFSLIALVLALLGSNLYAQNANSHTKKDKEQRENLLKEKLNLTDSQSEQIKAIREKQKESTKLRIGALTDATKEQKMQIMKEENEKADALINSLLNEEQKKTYANLKAEKKEERKQKIRERRMNNK